jgi:ferric-dicitrate binding protein FerR (iron transport regulator)
MGTAFDIKAYPGEQAMMVSVQRGKVKVATGNKILATLEKGRQVTITANGVAQEHTIDPEVIAGWRQGHLYYKDEVLSAIIADLQRAFNVTINLQRASLKQEQLTVSLDKNAGLPSCLDLICRLTESRLHNNNGVYSID